ncbi:uncharacterized protein UV8b_03056 [Ustilaginoidea virens]|uniref:Signal recognition particle subunit SRP14 n=1 Tax=Ustilaginoidea virens TaxID=1159556 RepID=A0A8E5HNN5_USTVR|nr:uncharacterized protein UV8b_03056 [Ustilaginoidea virens]QUC18815.1 hypothetical protein UV8b_03056 [Ustilaginoidea virens]
MPADLPHDEFFSKLALLFSQRRDTPHGAIYLSQKRLSFGQAGTDAESGTGTGTGTPFPVIVRASNGKSKQRRADKVKLSTVVQPHDLDAFYARYADVCKAGMAALKPRDRSKKRAKAKKKKAAS